VNDLLRPWFGLDPPRAICSDCWVALDFPTGSDTLPAGRHVASVAEIEAALVDGFPRSRGRRPLFESWLGVREGIRRIVAVETEWIDGSYVTKKEEPADLDLVTHIEGDALDALDSAGRAMLAGLVANKLSQLLHGCDSYICPVYPAGHPQHALYQQAFQYWDKWFGQDRNGHPKGYVEVT
jgi:uncharacterized protein DUF6932